MADLVRLTDDLAGYFPPGSSVVYLDYPLHSNVGDLLIMLGTLAFFEKHALPIRSTGTWTNTPKRGRLRIESGDVIVLQGGGNFGDIYPEHLDLYERIAAEYPDHRLLIFPQSIHFGDTARLALAVERLGQHPDLTIFVRDHTSERTARDAFGDRVRLIPDMAHQLWPTFRNEVRGGARRGHAGDGPLLFMRRDAERVPVPAPFLPYADAFVDWQSIVPTYMKVQNRSLGLVERLERAYGRTFGLSSAFFAAVRVEVRRIARMLDRHDVWVTSRLHGVILGLLLDKSVFALDNTYGKLSNYLGTWREFVAPVGIVRDDVDAAAVVEYCRGSGGIDSAASWEGYERVCASFSTL